MHTDVNFWALSMPCANWSLGIAANYGKIVSGFEVLGVAAATYIGDDILVPRVRLRQLREPLTGSRSLVLCPVVDESI